MKSNPGRRERHGTLLILAVGILAAGIRAASPEDLIYVRARKLYIGRPLGYIENGGMLVRDGLIVRLDKKPRAPRGVRTIDFHDRTIIPGLVDAHSHLGFGREDLSLDMSPAPAWRAPLPENMRAYFPMKKDPAPPGIEIHFRAGAALFPRDEGLLAALAEGVTLAKIAIPTAGLTGGISSCVNPGASGVSGFLVKERAAMEFSFSGPPNVMSSTGSLRKLFLDARDYRDNIEKARVKQAGKEPPPRPAPNEDFDVLLEVLDRRIPLMIQANSENEILAALEIMDEFRIRLVLVGCGRMGGAIEDILSRKVPVIIDPMELLDGDGDRIGPVKRLLASGLPVALGTGARTSIEFFAYALDLLVQAGLNKSDVLDMASAHGAKVLGLAGNAGFLAPGASADFAVLSGEPFDLGTRVEQVFVKGRKVFGK